MQLPFSISEETPLLDTLRVDLSPKKPLQARPSLPMWEDDDAIPKMRWDSKIKTQCIHLCCCQEARVIILIRRKQPTSLKFFIYLFIYLFICLFIFASPAWVGHYLTPVNAFKKYDPSRMSLSEELMNSILRCSHHCTLLNHIVSKHLVISVADMMLVKDDPLGI